MTLCWLSVLIWILKAGNPCRVIHKLIPYKYNVHTQNLFYFKFSYFQKIISIFLKEIDWCFTLAKSLPPRSETGPCSFGNEDHVTWCLNMRVGGSSVLVCGVLSQSWNTNVGVPLYLITAAGSARLEETTGSCLPAGVRVYVCMCVCLCVAKKQ